MEQTELHEKFTISKSTLKVFKLEAQRATCRNTPLFVRFTIQSLYMSIRPYGLFLTDTFLSFPITQILSPLLMKN